MDRVTTFRYPEELKLKLDELRKHFDAENLGKVSQSAVIILAINELYEKYIVGQ